MERDFLLYAKSFRAASDRLRSNESSKLALFGIDQLQLITHQLARE